MRRYDKDKGKYVGTKRPLLWIYQGLYLGDTGVVKWFYGPWTLIGAIFGLALTGEIAKDFGAHLLIFIRIPPRFFGQ